MIEIERSPINMYGLLVCLSNAGDLVRHGLENHHQQVAYLSFQIAGQLRLPYEQRKEVLLAGLLHDVGALSVQERLELLELEPSTSQGHAFRGARLLEQFGPLRKAAGIIRYHHVAWDGGKGTACGGKPVPLLSHILHLADRVAVQISREENIIGQIHPIRSRILEQKGTAFMPELVDAFLELSGQEYIWLDLVYEPLIYILPEIALFDTVSLTLDDLVDLSKIFSYIIDFRSPFTAIHSAGVAACARRLAEFAGFSPNECKMMQVAGNLHDLGKLAVDNDILEKTGPLDASEFNSVRSHTFYTYRLLQAIEGFDTINRWASFHHEKLDGTGYPFHLSENSLPLGSRIMAVADIFSAITEDRPYRRGMPIPKALEVLQGMVDSHAICGCVFSLLRDHIDEISLLRSKAQRVARRKYRAFHEAGRLLES